MTEEFVLDSQGENYRTKAGKKKTLQTVGTLGWSFQGPIDFNSLW